MWLTTALRNHSHSKTEFESPLLYLKQQRIWNIHNCQQMTKMMDVQTCFQCYKLGREIGLMNKRCLANYQRVTVIWVFLNGRCSRLNVIVSTSTMRILVISSLSPSLSGVQSMQLCCRWKMSWTGGTLNITWKSASAGSKCCVLFILTWFVNTAELELSADSSRAILS